MVKQKLKRNEAEWKNVYLKRTTVKELQQLQLDYDLLTYDQTVQLLLQERKGK